NAPPANWAARDFNDSAWPIGRAKFGAGGGPTNVITSLPPQKPAYYFRKQFLAPSNEIEELLLAATCTDAYGGIVYPIRVYLNGAELMTTGIETVTGPGNETRYFDLFP